MCDLLTSPPPIRTDQHTEETHFAFWGEEGGVWVFVCVGGEGGGGPDFVQLASRQKESLLQVPGIDSHPKKKKKSDKTLQEPDKQTDYSKVKTRTRK